jgi:hypothetical protein
MAELIDTWTERHQIEHPPNKPLHPAPFGHRALLHYGAARYLCEQGEVTYKELTMITQRRVIAVQLSIADGLAIAMKCGFLIGSVIPVYANPKWPRDRVIRELKKRGCVIDDRFWLWPDELEDGITL